MSSCIGCLDLAMFILETFSDTIGKWTGNTVYGLKNRFYRLGRMALCQAWLDPNYMTKA